MKVSTACAALLAVLAGWMVGELLDEPMDTQGAAAWSAAFAANDGVTAAAPRWVVDPREPGSTLPPVGRSLFDLVVTSSGSIGVKHEIPFPFEALVERIETRAGCVPPDPPCTRQVLIPLGRSLQRTAASPDFFRYPRVVVAVDREGGSKSRAGMLLKDRLYLGYQEKSNLIEVISYNETAARFEFQLVKDYRPGGAPRIVYADRSVCVACHQNHAPLFSRQQWDETNANPRVAALLAGVQPSFYGIPARRGVEVPNAIDDAIHRANLLSVGNLLWREGCGASEPEGTRCRGAALLAAWQYRLSSERGFAASDEFRERVVATLARNADAQWPGGLAIPNPEIPNRDPLSFLPGATGLAMASVPAGLEPLAPRAPLATWPSTDPSLARRFVVAFAQQIADADVRAVDATLASSAKAASRERFAAQCEIRRGESELRFQCRTGGDAPGASLNGRVVVRAGRVQSGEVASLALPGDEPILHLAVAAARIKRGTNEETLSVTPTSRGQRARLQDGRAIESIQMRWNANGKGEGLVTVVDDFGSLRDAITTLESGNGEDAPLARRASGRANIMAPLFAQLGIPLPGGCCQRRDVPPVEADTDAVPDVSDVPVASVFRRHCVPCHQTPEHAPPNFLHGDAGRVSAALATCAPRIFVRVSMWQSNVSAREKTPMPPAFAVHLAAAGRGDGPDPGVIASLRDTAGELLRAETGRVPTVDELLIRGYENLRPCLPAGS